MPKVEDIFSKLNGAKYFSTLDLRAGYYHISFGQVFNTKNGFQFTFQKV